MSKNSANHSNQSGSRSVAIISLHFSISHTSHLIAWAKLFQQLGYAVTFILDEKYHSIPGFSSVGDVFSLKRYQEGRRIYAFDAALIYNSALENYSFVKSLRRQGTKSFHIFHEPESFWSRDVWQSEGIRKSLRFVLSAYCSIRTLLKSSGVIVGSAYARSLYIDNHNRFNRNIQVMPLLFDDEIGEKRISQMQAQKLYFGFVGTACKAHGFDAFVEFAKYALRNGSDIPFVIATGVDLSLQLKSDEELAGLVQQGKIRLQHGRRLSNDEINQYYLECFCIWNVYRRSTQSGVLPRSFMTGTPVLASRIGSFPEDVFPGLTGEFVDANEEPAAILAIVERMQKHANDYFDECRKRFLKKFHYAANRERLVDILKSVSMTDFPLATTTNR